jgi:glutamyl/glutaminyl-tRNA synthetase
MFFSLPLSERQVRATEQRLEQIYEAAKLGLRNDNLAYAANMTPTELRRLQELDPLARQAEEKGRADSEFAMAQVVFDAARAGDAKAAIDFLKHQHKWVATQHVQIDVEQRISIIAALEQAQTRVIEGTMSEAPERVNAPEPLTITDERASNGYAENITRGRPRAAPLRAG